MRGLRGGGFAITVALALLVVTAMPASAKEKKCDDVRAEANIAVPHDPHAIVVDFEVGDDCVAHVKSVKHIKLEEVPAAGGESTVYTSFGDKLRGDKPKSRGGADPEYHIMNRVLDPAFITLTSLQTDLYWTSNGSTMTSGSGNNTLGTHPEDTCYPPDGWHLQTYSGGQSGGGVGYTYASWSGHAEWWYRGFFSACDPNVYYNKLDTTVTGYANGSSPYCGFSMWLKATYPHWHLQVYCWSPTIWLQNVET